MEVLIIIVFVLALYHFVYETIVAPFERLNIRYKMFKIRDDLRRLKIDNGSKFNDALLYSLDTNINNAIRLIPVINISMIYKTSKAIKNIKSEIRHKIDIQNQVISSSQIEDLKFIKNRINKNITKALIINSGGWVIYLLPIVFIGLIIMVFGLAAKHFVRNYLYKVSERILYLPPSKMREMVPEYVRDFSPEYNC